MADASIDDATTRTESGAQSAAGAGATAGATATGDQSVADNATAAIDSATAIKPYDDECVTPSEPEAKAKGEHIGAVVYFSSVSNNTARFIESCGFPDEGINVYRIPLRPKEAPLQVREPYVLIVPTYGGGNIAKALLPQIRKFLNGHKNRSFIRGVISSGNRNFATAFCAAGDIISKKCHVPFMYNFELLGTPDDQRQVRDGIHDFFLNAKNERDAQGQEQ
ncbi:MAG: class Ib ribonucleoside-diphosphate reductase assembly flavoprotein NrdI [Bifidobacterium sp.]|nr:class Ib ribonucleoside-diphosphate reductase assembly flavoprotein NrdI [Bifidobacterium sp.]